MALRIRKNGRVLCAALNKQEEGDCYIDDSTHYYLSVEKRLLVTTEHDYHMANGGEWWWKGQEPSSVKINSFYYEKT